MITAEVENLMAAYAYFDFLIARMAFLLLAFVIGIDLGHALGKSFVAWPSLSALYNRV